MIGVEVVIDQQLPVLVMVMVVMVMVVTVIVLTWSGPDHKK